MASSVRASMDFNGPLNALSTSPNNRLIAVGGRDGPSMSIRGYICPAAAIATSLLLLTITCVLCILFQCSRSWHWKLRALQRSATCASWASQVSTLVPMTFAGIHVRRRSIVSGLLLENGDLCWILLSSLCCTDFWMMCCWCRLCD